MILNEISFDFSNISGFSLTVAIVGYLIVFGALVLLFFIYNLLPVFINFKVRRKLRKEGKCEDCDVSQIEGNVSAAISMALYLHLNEIHDEESDVITIKRVSKQYTPWSSKIYSTNPFLRSN
ncbi:MAG: OadG family protein [Bacteroidales bacterium]|nr:OadG family protein [Bacteroidales bacterium]